jgi:hypothetical protein
MDELKDELKTLRRMAAICAMLSGTAVTANLLLGLMAIQFKMELLDTANVARMMELGEPAANLLYYSWVSDMFNYLLKIPIVVYVWKAFEARQKSLSSLYAVCGLAYTLIGSIGAVILAVVEPDLLRRYAAASAEQREDITLVFQSFHSAVMDGMWPLLETIPFTVWLVGLWRGLRPSAPAMGMAALVMAGLVLLSPLVYVLRLDSLRGTVPLVWVFLYPFWAFALGFTLLKRRPE